MTFINAIKEEDSPTSTSLRDPCLFLSHIGHLDSMFYFFPLSFKVCGLVWFGFVVFFLLLFLCIDCFFSGYTFDEETLQFRGRCIFF